MGSRWRIPAVAALAVAVVAAVFAAQAVADTPTVVPKGATYRGQSYAGWTQDWWRWAYAEPAAQSPLTDATGARCHVDQTAKVFFLAGSTGFDASRDCTVPAGTPLLIPAFNVECSVLEGDAQTPAGLPPCAKGIADLVDTAATGITVDGRAVPLVRVPAGPFPLTFAPGNAFRPDLGGATVAAADGFWALLHPLPPGSHVIRITASVPAFGFALTVVYELTVAPGRS